MKLTAVVLAALVGYVASFPYPGEDPHPPPTTPTEPPCEKGRVYYFWCDDQRAKSYKKTCQEEYGVYKLVGDDSECHKPDAPEQTPEYKPPHYPQQKPYSPPQKPYSPPQKPYSPPQKPYSPPQKPYSPPQKPYSPPQKPYSPPQKPQSPPPHYEHPQPYPPHKPAEYPPYKPQHPYPDGPYGGPSGDQHYDPYNNPPQGYGDRPYGNQHGPSYPGQDDSRAQFMKMIRMMYMMKQMSKGEDGEPEDDSKFNEFMQLMMLYGDKGPGGYGQGMFGGYNPALIKLVQGLPGLEDVPFYIIQQIVGKLKHDPPKDFFKNPFFQYFGGSMDPFSKFMMGGNESPFKFFGDMKSPMWLSMMMGDKDGDMFKDLLKFQGPSYSGFPFSMLKGSGDTPDLPGFGFPPPGQMEGNSDFLWKLMAMQRGNNDG